MNDRDMYKQAQERAESKIRFYIHLAIFLGVNAILAVINLKTSPGSLWFLWPFCGWGIAIVLHGLKVLNVFNLARVKKQMIEKELAKEKYRHQMEENK